MLTFGIEIDAAARAPAFDAKAVDDDMGGVDHAQNGRLFCRELQGLPIGIEAVRQPHIDQAVFGAEAMGRHQNVARPRLQQVLDGVEAEQETVLEVTEERCFIGGGIDAFAERTPPDATFRCVSPHRADGHCARLLGLDPDGAFGAAL